MVEIVCLSSKQIEEATEVLFSAFYNDPLASFFFGDTYDHLAKHLWRYICQVTLMSEELLLGASLQGKLLGVVSITPPQSDDHNHESDSVAQLEANLLKEVGEEIATRLDAHVQVKNAQKPKQPHFYLNVLGVHPHSQGKGVGRALLTHLHALAQEHPACGGTALDTENENNIELYERFGYRVTATEDLEGTSVWCMFRPKRF